MLVLSRKVNERIKINDDIEIVVVSVAGDVVRIGIEAPKDVKILRSEVYEEISRQNRAAAEQGKGILNLKALNELRTKMNE
ncbi:MAG: carbon storage regulator CsrA [Peptococcaceae bacterium]|jgi:carbon storage regulator|nr:carbon storage regulator CsrA [Peptococcaceae bacterium]